jgi:glutathione-specific gamma-glutamylcyclotransferase
MTSTCHWVFGYGSLMWRPGFSFLRSSPATVHGFHRRLCVYSYHYRGREGAPGVVLGLRPGGSCRGMAFAVANADWPTTLDYLRERELVTKVYQERLVALRLADGTMVQNATTYVVDRAHGQYTGLLDKHETAALVRQGHGLSGSCEDYLRNTLAHLHGLAIKDRYLETIAKTLAA